MFTLRHELPLDLAAVEMLYDQCFGRERHQLPAYHLRQHCAPIASLCRIALSGDEDAGMVARGNRQLIGALRFWPVLIGDAAPALLLGPLAVAPHWQRQGVGKALMTTGLHHARTMGHARVLLVGDLAYYHRFGFRPAADFKVHYAAEPQRLLAAGLDGQAWQGITGALKAVGNIASPHYFTGVACS